MGIDCGSDLPSRTFSGRVYREDRAYGLGSAPDFGHVGGIPFGTLVSAEGTRDTKIYSTFRIAPDEYRIDLPIGLYVVRLQFTEAIYHAEGDTVFEIELEGQAVSGPIDLICEVGKDYAYEFAILQSVTDGTLNISFNRIIGAPCLFGVEVLQGLQPSPLPIPRLEVRPSFARNELLWDHVDSPDTAFYRVYRSDNAGGPFGLCADEVRVKHFVDRDPALGWYYRVSSVDVYGQESVPSATIFANALPPLGTPLPVYSIAVSPDDLLFLRQDPARDDYVPAALWADGTLFPQIELRYRGGTSRGLAKKSFKFRFPDNNLFDGRSRVNTSALATEKSMLRDKLSLDLFRDISIPASTAEPIHLILNGNYHGLYLKLDQMNEEFLESIGIDPASDLYKCDGPAAGLRNEPDFNAIVRDYEKDTNAGRGYADLFTLIEVLNNTDEEEFPVAMHRVLDVRQVLRYFAMINLISKNDFTTSNYFLLRDVTKLKWSLLPWDNDQTFGFFREETVRLQTELPLDYGSEDSSVIPFGDTNRLLTRLLRVPAFRRYYADTLSEYLAGVFSAPNIQARVQAAFDSVSLDARRDLLKWGRESNRFFNRGPEQLMEYVTKRTAFVASKIPTFEPSSGPFLSINEFGFFDEEDLGDDPLDAWVEIYNLGVEIQNLSGYRISVSDRPHDIIVPSGVFVEGGSVALIRFDSESIPELSRQRGNLDDGDVIIRLLASTGGAELDSIFYPGRDSFHSFGRMPDASPNLGYIPMTPGLPNFNGPSIPQLFDTTRSIAWPDSDDSVSIRTAVVSESEILSVLLVLQIGDSEDPTYVPLPMFDDGAHDDEQPGDGIYGIILPPSPDSTRVRYFATAVDSRGMTVRDPAEVPDAFYEYVVGQVPPSIAINEFMADNKAVLADPAGDFDDWIELYNFGSTRVDLSGFFLTDDLTEPGKWRIPDGVGIDAGQWMLFWADDEESEGWNHTNFRLSKSGEQVGLFTPDGSTSIRLDSITFGPQLENISMGRLPDGVGPWIFMTSPTPGGPNVGLDADGGSP